MCFRIENLCLKIRTAKMHTSKNYIYNIDLLFFFYRFALRKLLKHRLKTQFVWKSVDWSRGELHVLPVHPALGSSRAQRGSTWGGRLIGRNVCY